MTAYQILVIDLADLTEITLVCPTCTTRITVAADAQLVERCPSCRGEFNQAAQLAQREWQRFRSTAATSGVSIEFPIGRIRPFERAQDSEELDAR